MITFKYTKVINDEIKRLREFDNAQVSPELQKAMNRYFKVRTDDLRESASDDTASRVPDIAKLINEA